MKPNKFLVAMTACLVILVDCLCGGFALSVLWGWFVVPAFAAPPLSVTQAIGVAIIVAFLTHQHPKNFDNGNDFFEKLKYAMFLAVFMPAYVLSLGWVVHMFM